MSNKELEKIHKRWANLFVDLKGDIKENVQELYSSEAKPLPIKKTKEEKKKY